MEPHNLHPEHGQDDAAVVVGGKIYLIGGFTENRQLDFGARRRVRPQQPVSVQPFVAGASLGPVIQVLPRSRAL